MRRWICVALFALSAPAWAGGGGANDPDLGAVHLSPEQEQHLGIRTEAVTRTEHGEGRTYRGVLVPRPSGPGAAFAPGSGTAETNARLATSWATAVEQRRVAEADRRLAAAELERATRLAEGDATSRRRAEEAQAAVDRADAALRAAREREDIARRLLPSADSALWVQVSVYGGDLERIDPGATATVRHLGQVDGIPAPAVDGPPVADPARATVDLFYDGASVGGRAGEVVSVELPDRVLGDRLAVPAASVVYDPAGVAWVFVPSGSGLYTRRRVRVRSADGQQALVDAGVTEGEHVVTDGVAELYGRLLGMGE